MEAWISAIFAAVLVFLPYGDEARAEAPRSTSPTTRSRKSFDRAFVMASLRESDAEDSLNSALLGILLRRIRFSPNEKCSNTEFGAELN